MKLKLLIPIALLVGITSCSDEESEKIPFRHVEILDMDHGVFNVNTIIEGNDAHSGWKYSHTDSINIYGIGYTYSIPDSLRQDTLTLNVKAWVRKGDLNDNGDIVVSISNKDSVLLWTGCNAKEFVSAPNVWSQVDRTFNLPINLTSREDVYINIMSFNSGSRKAFDVDDLIFDIKN
jgi:hypothetical protein